MQYKSWGCTVEAESAAAPYEHVTILRVTGRPTLGDGSALLRNTIRDLVKQGRKNQLLDLVGVSYVDSSGIGELVSGFTAVTNAGGMIKLLGAQKQVKDLLQITKLWTVFDVFNDEQAAVESFGPPRGASVRFIPLLESGDPKNG